MTGAPRRFAWLALCLLAVLAAAQAPARAPLTVMTFNIRYGTANDGENRWAVRKDFLIDVVKEQAADVIGLQEALDFQIDEIIAAVPAYGVIGVGRNDAARKGEYAAILYRRDRFQVADAGTFWFSDTPSVVASTSWGNRITRICTWARLVDRDGRAFWHFNVHLDHESQPSREKSALLLRKRIDERAFLKEPVIVTGDFNAGEQNPAVTAITAGGAFLDTFRVKYPDEKTVGTFTGFDAAKIAGEKIDYVFAPAGADVLSAAIVRTARSGRLPSDHFPVVAQVRLKD
jgi:endonuclease/exonuclease/phosphatase family metal-dependent hydrolase